MTSYEFTLGIHLLAVRRLISGKMWLGRVSEIGNMNVRPL